eukprot:533017-Pelagomonas_calceolata.AAC.3
MSSSRQAARKIQTNAVKNGSGANGLPWRCLRHCWISFLQSFPNVAGKLMTDKSVPDTSVKCGKGLLPAACVRQQAPQKMSILLCEVLACLPRIACVQSAKCVGASQTATSDLPHYHS